MHSVLTKMNPQPTHGFVRPDRPSSAVEPDESNSALSATPHAVTIGDAPPCVDRTEDSITAVPQVVSQQSMTGETQFSGAKKSQMLISQAYTTASAHFADEIFGLIDHNKVRLINETQHKTYKTLCESRETLSKFNEFSEASYRALFRDLQQKTKLTKEMRRDLDYIFKKINKMRSQLEQAQSTSRK